MQRKSDNINRFYEFLDITRHGCKYKRELRCKKLKVKDGFVHNSLELEHNEEQNENEVNDNGIDKDNNDNQYKKDYDKEKENAYKSA